MTEDETLRESIQAEWDTKFEEVVIEVVGFLLGGVIGGIAFQVVLADWSLGREARWYIFLLIFGFVTMWAVYAAKDVTQGYTRYREGRES